MPAVHGELTSMDPKTRKDAWDKCGTNPSEEVMPQICALDSILSREKKAQTANSILYYGSIFFYISISFSTKIVSNQAEVCGVFLEQYAGGGKSLSTKVGNDRSEQNQKNFIDTKG